MNEHLENFFLDNPEYIDEYKDMLTKFSPSRIKNYIKINIAKKITLDIGCGIGTLPVILLNQGAYKSYGIDSRHNMPDFFKKIKNHFKTNNIKNELILINSLFDKSYFTDNQFDLITLNSVTEHIWDLRKCLREIYAILKPGGILYIDHDNYYGIQGSHDPFWTISGITGKNKKFNHVKCWESPGKCKDSENTRKQLFSSKNMTSKNVKKANKCETCKYYIRSQPWYHLRYPKILNEMEFKFSLDSLNYITLFQLQNYINEAGFTIRKMESNNIFDYNLIIDQNITEVIEKLKDKFSTENLLTTYVRFVATKA